MKSYERESFLKIFLFLFGILLLFDTIVSILYYKQKISELDNNLLLQMREYNYNFKGKKFEATIIKKSKGLKLDYLYKNDDEIYALFLISKKSKNLLKIIYPIDKYQKDRNDIVIKIVFVYILFLVIFLLMSLFYASYALKPIRESVRLIEDFLKDIIHDINTPITTILLNVKFLLKKQRSEELERIEVSAKRILSLYKNFEIGVRGISYKKEKIDIKNELLQKIEYFKKLYPKITFVASLEKFEYKTDREAFSRIIDNLLSNACKYSNPVNPKIVIKTKDSIITIEDNGKGIKNVEKVFDRFYKESEMGIGIGMNIVKKLCDELGIDIKISSQVGKGTKIVLTLN